MRILRGLTSRILPCGCTAGIYETYDAHVVSILDEREASCVNPHHKLGEIIPELAEPHSAVSDSRDSVHR